MTCNHPSLNRHGYCNKCKLKIRVSVSDLEKERSKQLISDEEQKRLDYFYWGIEK